MNQGQKFLIDLRRGYVIGHFAGKRSRDESRLFCDIAHHADDEEGVAPRLNVATDDVCLAHKLSGKRFIHNRYTLAGARIIF